MAKKAKKKVVARKGPSAAQKRSQDKIAKVNKLAVRRIYDAGERGTAVPSWSSALRAAAKQVYKKK